MYMKIIIRLADDQIFIHPIGNILNLLLFFEISPLNLFSQTWLPKLVNNFRYFLIVLYSTIKIEESMKNLSGLG